MGNEDTLPSRDELVTMVARAHGDAPYAESQLAGRNLAAQSKLPEIVAENLGAGFGQWDFFPAPAAVVDFALGYVPPAAIDDVLALAKAWAADDANARPTVLALVGREILQHELRRFELPDLRAVVDEVDPARARAPRGGRARRRRWAGGDRDDDGEGRGSEAEAIGGGGWTAPRDPDAHAEAGVQTSARRSSSGAGEAVRTPEVRRGRARVATR